jgi:hypothetical protein
MTRRGFAVAIVAAAVIAACFTAATTPRDVTPSPYCPPDPRECDASSAPAPIADDMAPPRLVLAPMPPEPAPIAAPPPRLDPPLPRPRPAKVPTKKSAKLVAKVPQGASAIFCLVCPIEQLDAAIRKAFGGEQ